MASVHVNGNEVQGTGIIRETVREVLCEATEMVETANQEAEEAERESETRGGALARELVALLRKHGALPEREG